MIYSNTDPQADLAMEHHHYGMYEPRVYGRCDGCGNDIFCGDTYNQLGGYRFCTCCVEERISETAGETDTDQRSH